MASSARIYMVRARSDVTQNIENGTARFHSFRSMTLEMSNEPLPASPPRKFRQLDWESVGRYLSGELSAMDREVVRRQLSDQPADDALVRLVDNVIQRRASLPLDHIDVESALKRIRPRCRELTPRSVLRRHQEAARGRGRTIAVSLLAIAVSGAAGLVLWQGTRAEVVVPHVEDPAVPLPMMRSHLTTTGLRDSVRLPDGSLAYLGPVSELRVPPGFGSEDRQVELSGEAYFEVAPGTHPFVVSAGSAVIRVLATTFSVRTMDSVRVAVASGSVLLRSSAAAGDTGVALGRGDIGVVTGNGPAIARPGTGTADDLAWITGRVVFRDAPIAEVARSVKRWYGTTLLIPDSVTASRPFYGEFETAVESAEVVLRRVAQALGLEVQFRADTAILTAAPSRSPG
jgi:ferric-dicitrate binding protein FerR (iron transport regulator)